ncbi:cytidine deaminase [Gordonia shandongensis]|uniref:cytidine deaminase n=1 Tax=Gordonia shandongensis TaxID=376351 RepID=UPI0004049A1A|nr:cytidine deaminase [Gordonia shandongensis]
MADEIDVAQLRDTAKAVMTRAYAPYSRFSVGAAGITSTGQIVSGANVENVSYGLGVCAEVSMVCSAVAAGALGTTDDAPRPTLRAVSVSDGRGHVLTPCGRCRQVLREFGGDDLLVDTADGPRRLGTLLPDAFGPDHLRDAARPATAHRPETGR